MSARKKAKSAPKGTPVWGMKGTPVWGKGSHQWGGGATGPAAGSGSWGNGFGNATWGGGRSLWDGFKGLFT